MNWWIVSVKWADVDSCRFRQIVDAPFWPAALCHGTAVRRSLALPRGGREIAHTFLRRIKHACPPPPISCNRPHIWAAALGRRWPAVLPGPSHALSADAGAPGQMLTWKAYTQWGEGAGFIWIDDSRRGCLVPKIFSTVSITSNIRTHTWSINVIKKITNYIV